MVIAVSPVPVTCGDEGAGDLIAAPEDAGAKLVVSLAHRTIDRRDFDVVPPSSAKPMCVRGRRVALSHFVKPQDGCAAVVSDTPVIEVDGFGELSTETPVVSAPSDPGSVPKVTRFL